MNTNIIDFQKYQTATVKTAAAKTKYFPLIYGFHTGSGEPLILFRFIKDDGEEKTKHSAEIINLTRNKE